MKKIFTLLFCAMATLTAAAQIQITKDGKEVKEGETLEFFAEEMDLGGFILISCEPQEPTIKNISGTDANVTIKVEKLSEADQLSVCSFGGCTPVNGMSLSKSGVVKAGNSMMTEVHAGLFFQGVYTSYNAKVTVTSGSFKRTFFEKFTYADPTGIEEAQADQMSVANNQFTYQFGSQADRQLNIYGVSGRLVKSEGLSQQGAVSLNGLHRGVYIYEVMTNGKRTAAHKFIVK